jgi:crotonobetainyl-CoA:carnitine CoA-transferase CaiB-like acyl-CoA transferase
MESALTGLKIIDLSRFAPGPYCSMILSDLGAEVIKVEENVPTLSPEQIEQLKKAGKIPNASEFASPDSPCNPLNRNKRSIKVNLKAESGKNILYKLAAGADVVIEGFRPGVAKRLNIDFETLKAINPRIIYCSISGYGQDGPYALLPGHDINYAAAGGAIGAISFTDSMPVTPGNFLGDMAGGGLQAAIGILAAVIARNTTGKGQFIDISMTDGVANIMALYLSRYFEQGTLPVDAEKVSCGNLPFYGCYQTKDKKYISLGCVEPPFFAGLCKVMECEQYIPFQMDMSKADEIKQYLTGKFKTRSRGEWFSILSKNEVAVYNVNSLDEIANDPQLKHRQMVVDVTTPEGKKVKQVGIAIKLSDTPGKIKNVGDKAGESTTAILTELGYTQEEIKTLLAEKVVGK